MKLSRTVKAGALLGLAASTLLPHAAKSTPAEVYLRGALSDAAELGLAPTCPVKVEWGMGDRSYFTPGDCTIHLMQDAQRDEWWSRMVVRHELAHSIQPPKSAPHGNEFRQIEKPLLASGGITVVYTCAYALSLEGTGREYGDYYGPGEEVK